jgi:acetyl-CoA carboxylase biotin carboxyl carrier protein
VGGIAMDYKAVEQLIKALSDSTVNELEIETNEIKIKMSKNSTRVVLNEATVDTSNYVEVQNASVAPVAQNNTVESKAVEVKEEVIEENLYIVKSPMVGTFYSAPSENADIFVKVGDKVGKGAVLCIVEAMKLMNEIECEVEGSIVEVLTKNGEMVEFGQPLFKIKL